MEGSKLLELPLSIEMWLRWGGRKLIAESPQPFLCMLQFNNCILTLCLLFLLYLSEVLLHLIARSWRSDVQFPCRKLSSAAAGHAASACSLRRLASLPCLIFADVKLQPMKLQQCTLQLTWFSLQLFWVETTAHERHLDLRHA